MIVDDPATLAEVAERFAAYETALGENDVAALDGFFWPSELALRFGTGESLYGFGEIAAFRSARVPPGKRELRGTQITSFGTEYAVTATEYVRPPGTKIGRQTQVWVKFPELGWRIVSAHVSWQG